MLFIFKSIFSSQVNLKQMTKEDIARKHFYLLLLKQPSTSPDQLREIYFRALSFDKKQEEPFIFESDVYFLQQKLKKQNSVDNSGNNPIIENYLNELRKSRPQVNYNYLKKVKEAALQKKDIDNNFELKLCAFDLYKELKSFK